MTDRLTNEEIEHLRAVVSSRPEGDHLEADYGNPDGDIFDRNGECVAEVWEIYDPEDAESLTEFIATFDPPMVGRLLDEVERLKGRESALLARSLRRNEIIGEMERALHNPPDERPFDGYDIEDMEGWMCRKIWEWHNA